MGRISYRIDADKQKAVDAFLDILQKQEDVAGKFGKIRRESDSAGDAIDKWAKRALTVGAVATAINKVIEMFDKLRERAKASAQGIEEMEEVTKKLSQISTREQMTQRVGMADQLASQFGFTTAGARQMVFSGLSLGFNEREIGTLARFRGFTTDPNAIAESVAGLRFAFGGKLGDQGVPSITNALLQSAAQSKVGVSEIAPQILTPAQSAIDQGASFEEIAGALGLGAVAKKSPEEVATRVNALLRAMSENKQTTGLGLLGGVQALQGMSEGKRRKILSESRAREGYGLLVDNAAKLEENIAEIVAARESTGTAISPIERSLDAYASTGEGRSLGILQSARAERSTAERQELGTDELIKQAVAEKIKAVLTRRGKGAVTQAIVTEFIDDASDVAGADRIIDLGEAAIRSVFNPDVGRRSYSRTGAISPLAKERGEENQQIVDDFKEAARDMRDAAKLNRQERERRRRVNPESVNEGI